MIKQMVTWKGPDQKTRSKTFYFDLTEFEVAGEMQLEVLHARFQKFQDEVIDSTPEGESRNLTPPEIREMLDMVKTIIKHAYGEFVEGDDGWEMRKENEYPGIWPRFVSTGGFNAVIWHLFKDGHEARATKFMEEIWPESYRDQKKAALKAVPDQPNDTGAILAPAGDDAIPSVDDADETVSPAEDKPWFEYTKEEMDSLNDDEFDSLLQRSKRGNNIPAQLLVIAGQRKNRE